MDAVCRTEPQNESISAIHGSNATRWQGIYTEEFPLKLIQNDHVQQGLEDTNGRLMHYSTAPLTDFTMSTIFCRRRILKQFCTPMFYYVFVTIDMFVTLLYSCFKVCIIVIVTSSTLCKKRGSVIVC